MRFIIAALALMAMFSTASGQQVCKDTDNGATDVDGDRCSDYDDSFCGDDAYDDVDFTLADMCCVCGGGEMVDAKEQKPHIDQVIEDLDACGVNLEGMTIAKDDCGADLDTCGNNLDICGTDLHAREDSLYACGADLDMCGDDLVTCRDDLSASDDSLMTCHGSLADMEKAKKLWQNRFENVQYFEQHDESPATKALENYPDRRRLSGMTQESTGSCNFMLENATALALGSLLGGITVFLALKKQKKLEPELFVEKL